MGIICWHDLLSSLKLTPLMLWEPSLLRSKDKKPAWVTRVQENRVDIFCSYDCFIYFLFCFGYSIAMELTCIVLFEFFSSLIHFYIGLYLEFCRFSSHDGIAVLSQISWALLWVFGYDIFLCAFPVVWGLLTDPAPCVPLPTSPSMPWQWYVSCASL